MVDLAGCLRRLLDADSVSPTTPELVGWGVSALDDHQFVVSLPGGEALLVRRQWAPFTDTDLMRAFGLLAACGTGPAGDGPSGPARTPWPGR